MGGELAHRLVNNALALVRLDEFGALSPEILRDFADNMGLFRILVFDGKGRLESSNPIPPGSGAGYGNLPREFLDPLLKGEKDHLSLGYRSVPRKGEQRFTAGAARKGGGAIVVNIQADALLVSKMEMGPGHLIKALGQSRGVHYVVIQDETGIQAASTDQLAFPFPADDPHLQPLLEGAEWVVREFDSTLGSVFEVSRVVDLPSGSVLLRVGMDAAPLQHMREDIRTHAALRIAVGLVSIVLITALFMAWQRQSVLDREVSKVTAQLRRHEAEGRRTEKLVAMGSAGMRPITRAESTSIAWRPPASPRRRR